jgi:5-methylthioadenosine/S-adenosylhomocysteine deaminase
MSEQTIIEHVTIVTMNPTRDILANSSIVITDNHITALGPVDALRTQYPLAKRIDAKGKVALPGLINCHTHIPMSLQKGLTMAVSDGIYRVMWPLEKALTPEDVYIGALVGGAEALKGGSTTVLDHYFFAEQTAQAVINLGLRGMIGHTLMSRIGPIIGDQELETGIEFVRSWKGKNPLVTPWLAPHASDTASKEWLLKLRQVASEEGVRLHLHVAQSTLEQSYVREQYGMGCVEYLTDIGFLGKDVLAAHCIYINDHELDLLAESGAHPIYCPMSHSLYGHPARAWEMLQRGTDVVIGTDCVTSNNVMDLVGELRIAGAAQKQMMSDASVMPSSKILEMVTVNAAAAIGMEGQLGTLAPGYLADLILLDFDGLSTAPNYSLLDNIVYCCNGRDVHTVIVNGKVVVQDHKLLTADETELVGMIEERGRALISKAVKDDHDLDWLWKTDHKAEF